jgi:hypothetical protein
VDGLRETAVAAAMIAAIDLPPLLGRIQMVHLYPVDSEAFVVPGKQTP